MIYPHLLPLPSIISSCSVITADGVYAVVVADAIFEKPVAADDVVDDCH
jgi:hypothetical protein